MSEPGNAVKADAAQGTKALRSGGAHMSRDLAARQLYSLAMKAAQGALNAWHAKYLFDIADWLERDHEERRTDASQVPGTNP